MALAVARGAHRVRLAAGGLAAPAALGPAHDVAVVLDVVDERAVDVGQVAERERADGEPVVVKGARQLVREGQRDVEDLAAHEARGAGHHVGLQLGAEVVPRGHAVGPVRRREHAAGGVDDPQVAEGERRPRGQGRRQGRQLGWMPDVVLIARRHEGGLRADACVAALEGAPGARPALVVLAHERPLGALLGVQRGQLALQARRVGLVHSETNRDHGRRIANRWSRGARSSSRFASTASSPSA
jgi:hypothetical protein